MAFTIIGLIPVLYAETISKQRLAEDGIYQMVRHLAEYATRHMLLERDGQYYLKVVTVHDLTSEALETPAKQDAFVLISLRPLLRKAAEYAERLGVDAEQRASWRTVAEHLYIPRDAEGFFLSADEGRRMGWPFFWIPIHCLSPRDPQIPAAQLEFWQSRLKAGPGHPWGSFVTSAMASGWGQGANADALLLAGINLETYGLGYFAEFGLEGLYTWRATMLANLPPFCTAHGAYLYAVAQYFVRGSIWEERLEIGPPANSVHAAAPWTIQRLRALGGGLVSAQRDLSTVNGTVTAPPEHALEVTLLRPTAFTGTVLELRVNETLRTIDAAESATFTVHAGETACFTLGASCRCGNAMLSC
jgi:hypothetical protein